MKLTQQEYEKILNNLNEYELEGDDILEMDEYLDAFKDTIDNEILKQYFNGKEPTATSIRDIMFDTFDAFIEKLDPVNADKKFGYLVNREINNQGELKKSNHTSTTLHTTQMMEKAHEMEHEDYVKAASIKYFNEKIKNGEPLSENEKTKFFDIPVHKTVENTDKIFKAIFDVEKSDKELDELKKNDEEQYKEASKGKKALDKDNIEKVLDSYKMLNDKVKKMGILETLFHLPSFFKLKSNIKNLKEKMVNKGINEKLIDDVASGKETIKGAFRKNVELNTGVKQINEDENAKKMESITKKAEHIKKTNEKSQAKAHSTSTKINQVRREKAIEHWKKMKQLEKDIASFENRMERGNKYVSGLQESLENERLEQQSAIKERDRLDKILGKDYHLSLDDVKDKSNVDLDDPKANYSKEEIELIKLCKQYCEKYYRINELENLIHEKEKALEPNGNLDRKKRELDFYIKNSNKRLGIEQQKLAKYMDIKLEELPDKLPQIDKMFEKKANDEGPLLFDAKELKKNSEVIFEDDENEEEYEDEKDVENNNENEIENEDEKEIENDDELRQQLSFDATESPLIPINGENNKGFISNKDKKIEDTKIDDLTND